ncbi:hypothetical protein [Microbacterium esteraromaticum]|nr:hypothetical protein [Microbacterium esteraromaticum]MBM7466813.1 hypothetical protein [Microbacterium esteraromaticum]
MGLTLVAASGVPPARPGTASATREDASAAGCRMPDAGCRMPSDERP